MKIPNDIDAKMRLIAFHTLERRKERNELRKELLNRYQNKIVIYLYEGKKPVECKITSFDVDFDLGIMIRIESLKPYGSCICEWYVSFDEINLKE